MARVWALPPGYSYAKSLPHAHNVQSAAISPDGSTILMGGADGTARRERVAEGRLTGPDSWTGKPISRVLYRPDGRVFLTVAEDSARLWDAETGLPLPGSAPIHHPRPGLIRGLLCAAFSPDGKRIFTGGADRFVRTWDASTGRFLGDLLRADDGVNALAIDREGKRIVTGDWTGHLRVWDSQTGRPIGGMAQHGNHITDLAFHPGGAWFLSASTDGTAQLWDWRDLQRVGPTLKHRASLDRVAISPDGRMIATSAPREGDNPAGAGAQLWDTLTGTPLGPPIRHQSQVVELAFSPAGDSLLTVGQDGFVRTWRLPSLPVGAPERLMDWARVVTGLALDGRGVVRLMEASERDRASAAMKSAGGSPFPDDEAGDEPGRQLQLAIDAVERGHAFAREWHLARSPIGGTAAGPSDPALPSTLMRYGDLLSDLGEWAGALKAYREVARLRPEDPVTAIHLGVACMNTGATDEGIAAFRRAIALHPGYARAYLNVGIALKAGQKTRSLPLPLLARVVAPHDPGLAVALEGLSWGDFPAVSRLSVRPLESAARSFPDSALLQTRLGIGRFHAGDFDRAIESLRSAIRLDPDASTAYRMMGTALIERTHRLLDPEVDRKAEAGAYYRLGKLVYEDRNIPKALEFFRKAEQLDPAGSGPPLARIASILEGRGEYGAALEAFEKSLRLDPSSAETRNDRAWLLATCPDPKFRDGPRAVEDARRAAELSGWKDPSILDTLAAAHAEVGDFREAVRWQERALSLQKLGEFEDRLALYRKGITYHQDGGSVRR
jgi:tetratricopeptide (TPR) repeat protein